jgi:Asparaginase
MSYTSYPRRSRHISQGAVSDTTKPIPRSHSCIHDTGRRATPEQRDLYKNALRQALFAGNKVLKDGGSAMDAAVAAVSSMEDCPLFNCAKGAVFNVAGKARAVPFSVASGVY